MLETMQKYAIGIRWLRTPLLFLSVLALILVSYVSINPGEGNNDALFIPGLLLFGWGVLGYSFINLFQSAPPIANSNMGFLKRQAAKLRRGIRFTVALGFIALTVALTIATYKLLTTGLG